MLAEIKTLVHDHGQTEIWMMDDNIAVNRKRFLDLADAIIAEGLHSKATFHGSMRGDNVTDEVLRKAKECGFKMVAFGLETGSERLMQALQKGETVAQVVEAIRMTDRAGLAAATTVIFGLPGETRQERWETMRLVDGLPLSSVRFNTLVPYPGTPVYDDLTRKGVLIRRENWANFAVQYLWEGDDIPYVPEGNNRFELLFDTMYANLSYYVSFSGVRRLLRSPFAGGNVVKLGQRWYLHPGKAVRIVRLGLHLGWRFAVVTCKLLLSRVRPRAA